MAKGLVTNDGINRQKWQQVFTKEENAGRSVATLYRGEGGIRYKFL